MGTADDSRQVTTASVYSIDAENQTNTQRDDVKHVRSWKSYIWDTWELPPDQRWMLFKVDAYVLTFASLGYFLKNIDQTNVNNAFLSGMKEDLGMYGDQLVTSTSIWTVGYVIGQIPSNLLLTRVSPRWVIPSLEVGWGLATICTSSVKSYQALYALRFLVGFFESGFYPGIHYMLGSWYTPREIGKRAMIFWLAGSVGTLFSGFLQAAAYTNLHGTNGYAGWRWLFIIDGIITLPLALAGYIFFPNLPQSGKKTWWTTEEEHLLSIKRMENIGRAGKKPWTKAKVKGILLSWHTYLLPLLYILWNNGIPQPAMGYWLKSFNADPAPLPGTTYTVAQINNLPLPTTGVLIVMALAWGWLSDGPCRGARWPFIYIGAFTTIIFASLMMKMPFYTNIKGRMVIYWLSNIGGGAGPLILSWINEICSNDTEKRALLVAMANDLAYVVQAVLERRLPTLCGKQQHSPALPRDILGQSYFKYYSYWAPQLFNFFCGAIREKAAKAEGSLPAIEPVESSSIEGDTSVGSTEDDGKVASPSRVKNVGLG
ncbi:hypothetical protein N7519_003688 [Penicillium mononematosum]|uniref:uncharacterized protein n=1 Tax=Penicillium mononematosum TaxID=268346 RepID=UPI00254973EF|nr:uncharacterized protein N7519_003688 [Penicillium mononematosum]KAJ6188780.1 hypothetical protein N7519_003688 [Penicillium mononematosum]